MLPVERIKVCKLGFGGKITRPVSDVDLLTSDEKPPATEITSHALPQVLVLLFGGRQLNSAPKQRREKQKIASTHKETEEKKL